MQITRFFETADHGSCFEDLEIGFPDGKTDEFGYVLTLSRSCDANAMLAVLPANLDQDWHNAPNRQFVCVLDGCLEVETSDGAVRRMARGDLFMADDTAGQGHRTRVLDGRPVQLLFVRLADDFDLAGWAA